ncbi:MAG: hypothetical protein M3R07_12050 [Gemmatimonadota bacterium]|nr:hypothetical protein [Gemmatimonadota bacterium]
MKLSFLAPLALATIALTACDESTPSDGPGTVTAALVSPNGAEGAAVVDVAGAVENISGATGVVVYTTPSPTGTRVILVRAMPGNLEMSFRTQDISRPPNLSVVEVADGNDAIRSSLTGYRVEFR